MAIKELTRCPYCNSSSYQSMQPRGLSSSCNVGREIFVQPDFEARRCSKCNLVFKSNVLDEVELVRYYSQVNHSKWESSAFYPTECVVLRQLNRLPPGKAILDFGCSSGRLLHGLVVKHECCGVEPNAQAALAAKEKGIRILTDEEWLTSPKEQFDAIVMMDVYEHLSSPREFAVTARDKLKPGGRLFIATGNADARSLKNDLANSWYLQNIEHLIMGSTIHFQYLASDIGFDILQSIRCSHYKTSLLNRMIKLVKQMAFDYSREESGFLKRSLVKCIPYCRRAKSWRRRPPNDLGRDHVVVTFLKPTE